MDFFDVYALIALFTFYTLLISKSILTHQHGRKVLALGKGRKQLGQKFLEVSFYGGIVLLTYLVMAAVWRWPVFGINAVFYLYTHILGKIFGFVSLNFGIILFAFGLASFKDAWRIGVDECHTDTLITDGVFTLSRNPIYLAMMLIFAGFFLSYPNFFFLGSLIFIVYAFNRQIRKEESLLETLFGDRYRDYRSKTYRFFGKKSAAPNKKGP
ncbi:MAG: isoprenylcysteine carboxylmethyltransferase family protein [Acholeplasmatales bacterium]|nr:MAG: isoprenylcysteine carboxylmethyltransferase family protein [Acholeplasmatales bacterium]